jgi:hypothetical protein
MSAEAANNASVRGQAMQGHVAGAVSQLPYSGTGQTTGQGPYSGAIGGQPYNLSTPKKFNFCPECGMRREPEWSFCPKDGTHLQPGTIWGVL